MRWLTKELEFPKLETSTEEGIIALGGDLSVERLLLAYKKGIFPWFSEDSPIIWWSPDPRFVLFPEKLKVSKSMKRFLNNSNLTITYNHDFESVIENCSEIYRPGQGGTWISDEMKQSYIQLHKMGYAKSVEAYLDNELVAGLYGIDLNNGMFCGESMFTNVSNASKAAFITFIQNTNYKLIDCQVYTPHLESLGAEEIPRDEFLNCLEA
ncbi:leucyl/phenylalanyl-tRNA--protein transferase [Flavobacteriaceae bacterium MAR_2010_188]|nr:leucyl/phenylalanyl-tRNA--protein transferase [Flavobacteriaceae bacterium MAR_2010_188]